MGNLKKDMKEFYSSSKPYLNQLKRHNLSVYGKYLDKIRRHISPGSKILDIGSGAGQVANFLADKGYDVTGIDISPLFIKESKKGKAQFKVMDSTSLKFKDNEFDAVISAETIEHVLEPWKMLDEAARVIKQKGILILRYPNNQNKLKQFKTRLSKKPLFEITLPNLSKDIFGEDEDLCHKASTADISLYLKKKGFKILESKPFFWRAGQIVARKQ
ncbi:hypothetical protein CO081_01230 [Candidatus Pacearchaeota archaeon CG_4_9_14_0_8_um_filter_35_24]|nr:MAG: hypothetical protein AUJ63_03235 [Candidatus Pacearchaeota archaeon CG1_02_35_32]PJB94468.1 MAG: hypothetical protein CO081_01230 [Candidatus Pacearchaeota archaeon CG_4_9_14_0_8_um_filter_35_24]